MSILDINEIKRENVINLCLSIFLLIFGIIYEIYSHGVISYYMIFSFLIPLTHFFINLFIIKNKLEIMSISKNLFSSGILTLTFLCTIKGVLDIYGTTNSLLYIYVALSAFLLLASIISYTILTPTK